MLIYTYNVKLSFLKSHRFFHTEKLIEIQQIGRRNHKIVIFSPQKSTKSRKKNLRWIRVFPLTFYWNDIQYSKLLLMCVSRINIYSSPWSVFICFSFYNVPGDTPLFHWHLTDKLVRRLKSTPKAVFIDYIMPKSMLFVNILLLFHLESTDTIIKLRKTHLWTRF